MMKICEYKYKCDRCNKMFYLIGDYKRHVNRKNPCKITPPIPPISIQNTEKIPPIPPILTPNNDIVPPATVDILNKSENIKQYKNLECSFCGKTFTRKDNLNRHLANRCKRKLKEETDTIKELLNKISSMEQKMSELTDKNNDKNAEIVIGNNTLSNNNNNINNINTNNNNNINNIANTNYDIKIIAFGEENLYDRISDDLAKKFISNGYQSVIQLVDYVHFNKDHPELQNVYI